MLNQTSHAWCVDGERTKGNKRILCIYKFPVDEYCGDIEIKFIILILFHIKQLIFMFDFKGDASNFLWVYHVCII